MGRPAKYGEFQEILQQKAEECRQNGIRSIPIAFKEIERWGIHLPRSAYQRREWWANVRNNSPAIAFGSAHERPGKPWQQAGFETGNVDIEKQTVALLFKGEFSPEAIARQQAAEHEANRAELARLKSEPEQSGVLGRLRKQRIEKLEKGAAPITNSSNQSGMNDVRRSYSPPAKESEPSVCRHPIYGALKGHIKLVAGTDLTQPADPAWGDRVWGKNKPGKGKK